MVKSKRVDGRGTVGATKDVSEIIDKQIARLADWRGDAISSVRRAIHEADPQVVEELKWLGTPTWTHGGIVCVAAPFKDKVKVTFPHGASLPDPKKLFNAGREGNSWRAIDIFEKDVFNESAFKELFRSGIAYNLKGKASAPKPTKKGN